MTCGWGSMQVSYSQGSLHHPRIYRSSQAKQSHEVRCTWHGCAEGRLAGLAHGWPAVPHARIYLLHTCPPTHHRTCLETERIFPLSVRLRALQKPLLALETGCPMNALLFLWSLIYLQFLLKFVFVLQDTLLALETGYPMKALLFLGAQPGGDSNDGDSEEPALLAAAEDAKVSVAVCMLRRWRFLAPRGPP